MAGNTNAVSFCVRNCGESMASFGVLRWMSSHCIANNIRHINATATPMTTCDCGETTAPNESAMRTPNMDDDSMSPAMTRSMPLNGSAFPAALAGRDCSV